MSPEFRKEIEDQIRHNERSVADATRESERIKWTLRETKPRLDRAFAELRRVGLLRD